MTDEDALLSAIAAHPDEDTPRLAYADWLDENDRHIRAEFIRVQIDITQKETLPRVLQNRYVDVWKRNQELLDNHRGELLGPLAALPADTRIEFRRGFVSFVALPVNEFLRHSVMLAGMRPLPRVRVTRVAGHLLPFLMNPDTGCVAELRAYSDEPDDEPPRYPDDLDLIDGIERLSRLEVLELEGCGINDLHLDLAFNFSLPALVELDLSANQITDEGLGNLLRTDFPRQLKRLVLGGNPLTDRGAIALAQQWPTGAEDRLEDLNLRFTDIGQPSHEALTARFGGRVVLF